MECKIITKNEVRMELKRYLIKLIKQIKDPETIILIYIKVKEIINDQ